MQYNRKYRQLVWQERKKDGLVSTVYIQFIKDKRSLIAYLFIHWATNIASQIAAIGLINVYYSTWLTNQ